MVDIVSLLLKSADIDRVKADAIVSAAGNKATPLAIETSVLHSGVSQEAVIKALTDYYQIPGRLLGNVVVPFEILRHIPEESARFYRLAPLGINEGVLDVGITDPDNLEARDALNFLSTREGMPFKLFLLLETDFERLLLQYKELTGAVGEALTELERQQIKKAEQAAVESKGQVSVSLGEETVATDISASSIAEDAPVTKIVATIIRTAIERGASDIHIEPMADKARVRFRVDGVLGVYLVLPLKVHAPVTTRIKVLSNMRLDEKRKPQDGRFSSRIGDKRTDFRVSTFPTYWGEKTVMRILGIQSANWGIDSLGLSDRNNALLRAAIQKPYGLILISGPTGSGKSTTLYSILSALDSEKKNILSLEDPVEYNIAGINQSQIRPEIGYTFATGLRTTLRQDPNIIMVGEIRDAETATLAVQAALTGHLVFSTIHTNNAIGIVPRLLDMGVERYLIPPTLVLGIAQRLVRTLCPGTGEPMAVETGIKEMIDKRFADLPEEHRAKLPPMDKVYRAKATAECPTGTRGRTAVFEMFDINTQLERAILDNKPQDDMYKILRQGGMLSMQEDAIIKSTKGEISFDEVGTLGTAFGSLDSDELDIEKS